MKLVTKKFIRIFIVLSSIGLLLLIVYWTRSLNKPIVDQECSDIVDFDYYGGFGAELSFEGCYGILVQEKNLDDHKYYIYDHQHSYSVAVLQDKNIFQIVGESMYLLQSQVESERIRYNANLSEYYAWYFVGGEEKLFTYKSYDDVSKYLSIDINSGEVTIYSNNLNEIPETERQIFQELENE